MPKMTRRTCQKTGETWEEGTDRKKLGETAEEAIAKLKAEGYEQEEKFTGDDLLKDDGTEWEKIPNKFCAAGPSWETTATVEPDGWVNFHLLYFD